MRPKICSRATQFGLKRSKSTRGGCSGHAQTRVPLFGSRLDQRRGVLRRRRAGPLFSCGRHRAPKLAQQRSLCVRSGRVWRGAYLFISIADVEGPRRRFARRNRLQRHPVSTDSHTLERDTIGVALDSVQGDMFDRRRPYDRPRVQTRFLNAARRQTLQLDKPEIWIGGLCRYAHVGRRQR